MSKKKPERKGILVRLLLPDFEKLEMLAEIERRALGPYVEGFSFRTYQRKGQRKMKESNFAKTYLPKWQAENPGGRLFRNNTGMAWQGKNILHKIADGVKYIILSFPKPIFYGIGLMKKSNKKGRKHPVGGGDYIGWTEKTICQIIKDKYDDFPCQGYDDCKGCDLTDKVAIFTNLEFKTAGIPESPDQVKFRKLVEKSGGISKVIKEGENV